jgi:hypothetical protein
MGKMLYLSYDETRRGGACTSRDPYSLREDAHTEVVFNGLSRDKDDSTFFPSAREIEVTDEVYAADEVYLVVVRYQDGDIFGTSYGNWGIWAVVASEAEALRLAEEVKKPVQRPKPGDPYRFWEGYFSHLEGVEIHSFRVGTSAHIIRH